ncbi:MAG: cytosine permease [Nitrososphaerota archaeon]|nr:cytosine permease [Aigarchaeota archaeon]MDW8076371.1 cytosine permease [Nitrososphaerota archaeon]
MKIKLPPEWGAEPVPKDVKVLGFLDYFVLWSSLGVGLLVLLAGSLLEGLSFFEVLFVSIIGSIIGSVMLALPGVIGSRYGVPTMVSLRPVLGIRASYLPTALNIVQLIGWTAFELMIMAKAATLLTSNVLGPTSYVFWVLFFGVWCMMLALGGPLVVVRKWLERVAIWLVYGSTIWITYHVFTSGDFWSWVFQSGGGSTSLLHALDLVIVMPISWWPLISDFNRFAKRPKSAFIGTVAGYTVSNTWFYVLGAALIMLLGIRDIVASIAALFFGGVALVLILVDETDNCFADIYSSAVSFQNIFPKTRQWKFIVLVTGIGIALAMSVPLAEYEGFLLMIGALFVPLLGVVSAEFFVNRSRHSVALEEFYEKAKTVRLDNMLAWFLGIAVYAVIARFMPDLGASLPSFAASFAFSVLIGRLTKQGKLIR